MQLDPDAALSEATLAVRTAMTDAALKAFDELNITGEEAINAVLCGAVTSTAVLLVSFVEPEYRDWTLLRIMAALPTATRGLAETADAVRRQS